MLTAKEIKFMTGGLSLDQIDEETYNRLLECPVNMTLIEYEDYKQTQLNNAYEERQQMILEDSIF